MVKTIAVIGAPGDPGSVIANRLAKAQYHVLLADPHARCPALSIRILRLLFRSNSLKAPQTSVEVISSVREASWEADIILLASPYEAQAEIAAKIKDVVTGKIVISMVNSLNEIHGDSTASAAEELVQLLPHAKVVSAFNTIFATHIARPKVSGKIVDVFVAGDDEDAVSEVMGLVKDAGFNPLFAGKLAMSRTLEHMMALLIGLSARNNYHGPVGWKVLHEGLDQGE
jgi:predicted dinucleotide-binding enzyme